MTTRKFYFNLRDEIAAETGYTKVELHQLAKDKILPKLFDQEECWTSRGSDYSTKNLSDYGWELFVEEFKNFTINIREYK